MRTSSRELTSWSRRIVVAGVVFLAIAPAWAKPVAIASPNGTLKTIVTDDGGTLRYSVWLDGKQVLAPSPIGIQSDGIAFGHDAKLGKPRMHQVNETYPFFGGKSEAVNRAREATVPVSGQGQTYNLDVHVADDGVGIRLRLPAKQGRKVEAELSGWTLPGNPAVWANTQADYEGRFRTSTLHALGKDGFDLPLTAKIGNAYVTITEAALKDYGDVALKIQEDGTLASYLLNDPKGWTTDSEVVQPWRVTIVARNLTDLVNTTLVQNLNPPADPSVAHADWIKPGRSSWQWMAIGAPKFDDQHQWVDWTKALGYEYYLVDEGWSHWTKPWDSLKSVTDYAKSKGVKVWLWVYSGEVKDPAARDAYFRRAAEIGIAGVKVDFPGPTNREWSDWYYDVARDAAAYKLLIDFHGATMPTGMERTWPNEITREGIRGHEYHITRYQRVQEPEHDVILPFTRYVVGHGDYTPTVFDPKELQGNTWSHELAQAIVFTSPFLCMGGNPADYLANPARDVLMAIPAVWDETRVLPGSEPGKIAGFARRRGNQWFIGVMNGADPAKLDISLKFLGAGQWKAIRLGDVNGKPDAWDRGEETVNSASSFHITMPARGGFVAMITK
jgi:alpha-glucosidase